jgi:hypothetical protein
MKPARPRQLSLRELPPSVINGEVLSRLSRERALHTVVRGALPADLLRRMLKEVMPRQVMRELPPEVWAGLAVSVLMADPELGLSLAQAIHDRLAWDREPADMAEWERLAAERPLEALWMGALSESKPVRKAFPRLAPLCLRAFRASPQTTPPSWEFTDGILEIHAEMLRSLREAEKRGEDAERKLEVERQRLDELRGELKQLRRENSELRAERAQAERRADALAARLEAPHPAPDESRVAELERRLRKAEKECAHLQRELERQIAAATETARPSAPALSPAERPAPTGAADVAEEDASDAADQNPRRRILRQLLRKLVAKGKIGASHTHEDNVYRGVPDHEKGIAKAAIDLLYREGLLLPKPTTTDTHVSLNPERTGEVYAILQGEVANPRLRRFVEGRG